MKEIILHRNITDDDLWDSICTNDEMLADLMNQIPKILKEERFRQNMSVAQLSRLSGVNNSIIYHYERGTTQISLPVFIKITSALNLDVGKIISINTSQKEETSGEKFSYIIQGLSDESMNFILKTIKDVAYLCRLEKNMKNK